MHKFLHNHSFEPVKNLSRIYPDQASLYSYYLPQPYYTLLYVTTYQSSIFQAARMENEQISDSGTFLLN